MFQQHCDNDVFEPDQAEDSDLMDQDDEDEGDKGSVREEEEEEEEDVYREEGRSRKVSQFLFYRYIFYFYRVGNSFFRSLLKRDLLLVAPLSWATLAIRSCHSVNRANVRKSLSLHLSKEHRSPRLWQKSDSEQIALNFF